MSKLHDPRQFQQLLQQQRQELLQQLALQRGGVGRVDAASAHVGQSQGGHDQNSSDRELELILDDRESAELAAISAALKRIDDGSYGVCVDCGSAIPTARLLAAPETLRCIVCQSQLERSRAPL